MTRYSQWGPASALAIAMENSSRLQMAAMAQEMAPFLYARQFIVLPYQTPIYVLRARAMYGGKKGRSAVKRLRALGLRPVSP